MVSDAEGQAAATAAMDMSAFAHMEKLLREETAGEFVVGKLLGRGGMAVVYLAEETRLGRKVALKVLPPELTFGHGVERFLREAKTAATLDHPHIIPIYRIASGGKLFWYAMKYLEGQSLDDVLKERGAYSLDETLVILEQVADALDYAHERKVIHRDIKPANVMLDQRDRVIITDFGIAKALTEGALTASGSVIGTPYFMSPEQGMGKPVTGAADQYSVAVMAFRMLSGHLPFDGDSAIDILHKHCMMEAPRLDESMPHLPDHVVAAVEKAMAKKADERFPNIKAFVSAMKDPTVKFARPSARTVLIDSGEVEKANAEGLKAAAKKRAAASAARTVMSAPAAKGAVAAAPEKKSRALLWVAIAAIVIGGGGFGAWQMMNSSGEPVAANTAPGANTPATNPGTVTPPDAGAAQTDPGAATSGSATPGTQTPPVQTPPVNTASTTPTQRTPARQPASTPSTPPQQAAQTPPPQPQPATQTPPPATETASAEATLQIILNVPGNVTINGVSKGERSRYQERLRAGTHLLSISRNGFVTIDTSVTLPAGETTRLDLTLVARP